jgi:hypothetical protein
MRAYLTGNFLAGLEDAGVPEDVLRTPVRRVANVEDDAVEIEDHLRLPTVWEMFGIQSDSPYAETAGNQARLEYYTGAAQRIKYAGNSAGWYWTASPPSSGSNYFCAVYTTGSTSNYNAGIGDGGVAPAFRVK